MPTDKPRIVEDGWWMLGDPRGGFLPELRTFPLDSDWRPVRIETTDHAKREVVLWACRSCSKPTGLWQLADSAAAPRCGNHSRSRRMCEIVRVEIPAEE